MKKTCKYFEACGNKENCLYCKGYEKKKGVKNDK